MNYDAQTAQYSLEYHQPEESRYSNIEEPIFSQVMDVLRNKGLTDDEQNQIIHLYVEATHAKFWEGWHAHGVAEAKQIINRYERLEANA